MSDFDRLDSITAKIIAHEPVSFGTPASLVEIMECEQRLGVIFPQSYRWFLEKFGSGTWPDDIYGHGRMIFMDVGGGCRRAIASSDTQNANAAK